MGNEIVLVRVHHNDWPPVPRNGFMFFVMKLWRGGEEGGPFLFGGLDSNDGRCYWSSQNGFQDCAGMAYDNRSRSVMNASHSRGVVKSERSDDRPRITQRRDGGQRSLKEFQSKWTYFHVL